MSGSKGNMGGLTTASQATGTSHGRKSHLLPVYPPTLFPFPYPVQGGASPLTMVRRAISHSTRPKAQMSVHL